jgi:WD40 repeat protein
MASGPGPDDVTLIQSDGDLNIWNNAAGQLLVGFRALAALTPSAIAVDVTHSILVVGSQGDKTTEYDPVRGRFFVTGHVPSLRIWDINKRSLIAEASPPAPVSSVDLSPDGRLLAAATGNFNVVVYEASHLGQFETIHKFSDYAWRVSFSPDGRLLAAAGDTEVLVFTVH